MSEPHPLEHLTDPDAILAAAAARCHVKVSDVRGPRRFRELIEARRLTAERLRALKPAWSYERIGRFLGGRGHQPIMVLLGAYAPPRKRPPAPVSPA